MKKKKAEPLAEAKIEPTSLVMIEKIKHITKITNNSDFNVIFSYKPIKPKRKYERFMIVRKGYFLIDEYDIDLSRISVSFEH